MEIIKIIAYVAIVVIVVFGFIRNNEAPWSQVRIFYIATIWWLVGEAFESGGFHHIAMAIGAMGLFLFFIIRGIYRRDRFDDSNRGASSTIAIFAALLMFTTIAFELIPQSRNFVTIALFAIGLIFMMISHSKYIYHWVSGIMFTGSTIIFIGIGIRAYESDEALSYMFMGLGLLLFIVSSIITHRIHKEWVNDMLEFEYKQGIQAFVTAKHSAAIMLIFMFIQMLP